MTTFLFWNIGRKSLEVSIANIALKHNVDVIMLAECVISPSRLLVTLNNSNRVLYEYAPSIGCEKVKIFTKFPKEFIHPISEDHRFTIRHLKLPGMIDILLSVVHSPSKKHWRDSSQAAEATYLSNEIRHVEKNIGYARTILVGDLNANPFEEGIVNANGLHGVMSRRIAKKKYRTVQRREYPFFYNPMWGLLGDASPNPPGTFYFSNSEHTSFFWHMFDQVLIRPDLLDVFDNKNLMILTSDGVTSFISRHGLPDTTIASDHLPILFRLKL